MKRVLRNRLFILLTEKQRKEGRIIKPMEVGRAIGVTRPTIFSWLNNEVNKYEGPIVVALCDYFGCELSDLLYIETVKDEKTPDES